MRPPPSILASALLCAALLPTAPALAATKAAAAAPAFPASQPSLWSRRPSATDFDMAGDSHLAAARAAAARIKAVKGTRNIVNTLAPYDAAVQHLDAAQYFASLMEHVHPDATFRDHATEMTRKAAKARTELALDQQVFKALGALDLQRVDAGTRHYVERQLLLFRLSGVDKDDATRKKLKALNDQATELQSRFDRNINDGTLTVTVSDPHELDGLPQDFIDRHKAGTDGLIRITTDYPDYYPVMQFANSDALRRKLFVAFETRAYPANREVLLSMMKARHEIATLMGYGSWADYNAASNMIGNGARIANFIAELDDATRPGAQRELQMLLAEKRKTEPTASSMAVYERSYYAEQLRRAQFNFDSQSVRPYFPYVGVRQGILDIAAELFHVKFRQDKKAPGWDPSVEVWEVIDDGAVIGRFYLDMHPRAGKFSHAEMVPILDGIRGKQLPEAALVCNFPAPQGADPALMVYGDVETFFHEFGHLMHWILGGKQRWAGISGISMEGDFVEAPSQMLEELIRSPQVLARFARHYQTQEPIPTELVMRMNRASAFGRAGSIARQNTYSAISYDLYKGDPASIDPDTVTDAAFHQYGLFDSLPGTHEYASFGHLGSYSSAYYTYMWDKVIALDFFAQFDAADPFKGDTALRYRKTVLEPGGSMSANDLVRNFLGRPQNTRAMSLWIGEEFASDSLVH
jgi:thimet oligopeptidase